MTPGARGDRTVHRNLFSTGNRIVGAVGKGGLLLYFDAPSPAGGPQKSIDEGHQEGVTHRAVHARVPVLSSQACAPPSRRPTPLCSCGATLPSARPLDGDIGASTTGRSFPQKNGMRGSPVFHKEKTNNRNSYTGPHTRWRWGGRPRLLVLQAVRPKKGATNRRGIVACAIVRRTDIPAAGVHACS